MEKKLDFKLISIVFLSISLIIFLINAFSGDFFIGKIFNLSDIINEYIQTGDFKGYMTNLYDSIVTATIFFNTILCLFLLLLTYRLKEKDQLPVLIIAIILGFGLFNSVMLGLILNVAAEKGFLLIGLIFNMIGAVLCLVFSIKKLFRRKI